MQMKIDLSFREHNYTMLPKNQLLHIHHKVIEYTLHDINNTEEILNTQRKRT